MKLVLLSVIAMIATAAHAEAKLLSAYTPVADASCVVYDSASLHKDAEIDFMTEECVGLGGYQVMISGGDLRYPLSLKYGAKEIQLTNVMSFHQVAANKIEWLFERSTQGEVTYKALIHRISYDDGSDKGIDNQVLVVTKLDKENSCPVAMVKKAKDMNEAARKIAEKASSMKCLDLTQPAF